MVHKKTDNVIGAVTIGDIRNAISGRDDNEIVYLDGFAFSACVNEHGNLEFKAGNCDRKDKKIW